MMWTNGDFKLSNIAVINKDNSINIQSIRSRQLGIITWLPSVEAYYVSRTISIYDTNTY